MIKLYLTDSYVKEFSATVTSVLEKDGRFEVTLDKTAFYPEGGGQYADRGTLGGLDVLDVIKRGDDVVHLLSAPLEKGGEVEGKIDFETRFSRMQSHAGEHIVSGIVHSLFGYNNVGFHLGDDVMTVDFDGPLTDEDIIRVNSHGPEGGQMRGDGVAQGCDALIGQRKQQFFTVIQHDFPL
jgi:alanyl-tRNA synthetase